MTRRLKICYLSERSLMTVLNWLQHPQDCLVVMGEGVPTDAVIQRVCYSYERSAFGLMISHESFDEVPEGEIPPEVSSLSDVVVPAKKLQDGGTFHRLWGECVGLECYDKKAWISVQVQLEKAGLI